MKKIFVLIVIIVGSKMIAQTTPEIVVVQFAKDCPNKVANWKPLDCYFRAEYLDDVNNTWRTIVYDRAGYVLHRDWKMENNYPVRIDDYFLAVYPNEKYQVWSSLDASDKQSYYIIHNDEFIWFDKDGKVKKYSIC
jgi:hypothetical protein